MVKQYYYFIDLRQYLKCKDKFDFTFNNQNIKF